LREQPKAGAKLEDFAVDRGATPRKPGVGKFKKRRNTKR
jgi:hypothetical protein